MNHALNHPEVQSSGFPGVFHGLHVVPRSGTMHKRSMAERFGISMVFICDLLALLLSVLATKALLHHSEFPASMLVVLPAMLLVMLYLIGGYDRHRDFMSLGYTSEHLLSIVMAMLVVMLVMYALSSYNEAVKPSRLFVPVAFGLVTIPTLYTRRVLASRLLAESQRSSILVLGTGRKAREFYRDYQRSGMAWRLEFLAGDGRLVPGEPIDGPGSPIVDGDCERRLDEAHQGVVAVLLACTTRDLSQELVLRLAALHCADVPVYTVESFHERYWRRVHVGAVSPEWLFDDEFRLAHGTVASHSKRLFDIVFSIVALVLTAPVVLLAMLLIRLESKGSALFRQERVGLDGQTFTIFKLRTMRMSTGKTAKLVETGDRKPETGEVGSPVLPEEDMYTRANDARITRVGRWLRLTRIDELPQLWNVLRGDMSLIGPRAEWIRCTQNYEQTIPNYHLRHLVRPGITGWAQVNYPYGENEQDTIEKLQYDLYYIRNFSLKLDFSIVLKTIHTMLTGGGR